MLEVLEPEIKNSTISLNQIELLDKELAQHFKDKLQVQSTFTRPLVSFQANKTRPVFRWYKYKEAFSASLVEYLFQRYGVTQGRIMDPFAGSGTALFIASDCGIEADGIELLPIGLHIIETKKIIENEFTPDDFEALSRWAETPVWMNSKGQLPMPELRITKGAYPEETKKSIEKYLSACQSENTKVRAALLFALYCVLEAVSYTRKDGQYLRWDDRSGRRFGKKPFSKGKIHRFDVAIKNKIKEIVLDSQPIVQQANMFSLAKSKRRIHLFNGSCLGYLQKQLNNTYDAVITSPPYCNRYDYTRTYALELALMGVDERMLANLRQEMISCTVENRGKDLLGINPNWEMAINVADRQPLLQGILQYLDQQKEQGLLNNNGIPRMIRGYFYELACVIFECGRILKPGSHLFMVNDNVRYAGAAISVDLILSSMAEELGFYIDNILVLPNGKGNSSQQMGEHGRKEMRKCVYVWSKK